MGHGMNAEEVLQSGQQIGQQTGQQSDSSYQSARARFESTLENARTSLRSAQDRSKDIMDSTQRYVRENPWQSVGIGAAAGLAIGYLLSRK